MSTTATVPFGASIAAAQLSPAPDWLAAFRDAGAREFHERGIPTSRDEEWRFTPVAGLARAEFGTPAAGGELHQGSLDQFLFGDSMPRVVLVDGRFSPEHSNLVGLPEGVLVSSLADAIATGAPGVAEQLGQTAGAEQNAFTALSAATFTDGLHLHVPAAVRVELPIHLVSVVTEAAARSMVAPRLLVSLGESAEASLVESYVALTDESYFTNTVVEIELADNARLGHTRVQRESAAAWHIGFTQVDQGRNSHYNTFALAMGGKLARHNLHARHHGEGVETMLYGLYLTQGEQLADTHSAIFHDQPNCNSWEVYKGILADKSRAVFNGKVLVEPIAQKTDAKQTNRNLLLSDNAKVDTKPQLEIFADDVRCTHGATIGRLNMEQRYYLKTRGIGGKKAEQLLTWAFAAEVMSEIAQTEVREELERLVHQRIDALTA